MPVHSWKVNFSLTEGLSFSYAVVKRLRKSSETLSFISQMLTVRCLRSGTRDDCAATEQERGHERERATEGAVLHGGHLRRGSTGA